MNLHTDIYLQGFIKLPKFYKDFTKFDDWVSAALILSWGFRIYTLLDDFEFEIGIKEEYLHIWDEV